MYEQRKAWLSQHNLTYLEYLQSEHWQQVKDRYYQTHRYRCFLCGYQRGLHLHHRTYQRIGREWLMDLVYLCSDCHAVIHGIGMTWRDWLRWLVRPWLWWRLWWARLR